MLAEVVEALEKYDEYDTHPMKCDYWKLMEILDDIDGLREWQLQSKLLKTSEGRRATIERNLMMQKRKNSALKKLDKSEIDALKKLGI